MKLEDLELGEKYKAIRNIDGQEVRFGLCYNDKNLIFVYGKRRKCYGWRMTKESFLKDYAIKQTRVTKKSKWEHNVARVVKTLEKSGLWGNILETFRNLQKLGYEERQRIRDEYAELDNKHNWKDNKCYNTVEYDSWLKGIEEKYPFLVGTDEENRKYIHTDYIWELSRAELKNMYFGKYLNEQYKNEIAKCLADKKKLEFATRTNYDVSFEYNAELGKAWYSEEYKGCGNGHYYLALDNNLALFCEDD